MGSSLSRCWCEGRWDGEERRWLLRTLTRPAGDFLGSVNAQVHAIAGTAGLVRVHPITYINLQANNYVGEPGSKLLGISRDV